MSSGDTLVDFVTWAAQTYPADKYVLILSDHGMGWPGGWSDPDPGRQGQQVDRRASRWKRRSATTCSSTSWTRRWRPRRQQAGIDKFELIGLDACLMGHVEVMDALAPHARYAVFSQETEPALGWAYTAFLNNLAQNPDADGAALGEGDRPELHRRGPAGGRRPGAHRLEAGSPVDGDGRVSQQLSRDITLTAVDLSQTGNLIDNLNHPRLQHAERRTRRRSPRPGAIRSRSPRSLVEQVPPSYIDLGHFLVLLTQSTKDQGVNQAARNLAQTLTQAVIAKKNGQDKPGATGLSIYFPVGQLYQSAAAGPQSYTAIANRFAQDSLWDEFLAFHYGGRTFQEDTQGVAAPARAVTRAPGTGTITLSPVQKDKNEVAIRDTVLLSTNVSGDNIGYIYFFTGYLDKKSKSLFVIDQDYLEAPQTKEAGGVYYPDWGEGPFKLEFEWEPLAYAITDGQTRAQAALMPETYGKDYQDSWYTVDGTYTYTDGEQRFARAYFRDGLLRKVMGFNQQEGDPGAPWQITTSPGDKFTVYRDLARARRAGRAKERPARGQDADLPE